MFGKDLSNLIEHTKSEIDLVARVTQHPERPKPLRKYDQIYMLPGSQLSQAKLISDYLYAREVVMVGDGDCMSLVLALLAANQIIKAPASILVLDFDSRILSFVQKVSEDFRIDSDLIETRRYNVREPVPQEYVNKSDVFYTNPPYGSKDKGNCGKVFLGRCMELCKTVNSWGVAILPFEHHTPWSKEAMFNIQSFLSENGYVVSEMIRGMHQYHLDDRPGLLSGTVVVDRVREVPAPFAGKKFSDNELSKFYGGADTRMPSYIDERGRPSYTRDLQRKKTL